jgi:hypothetical protein
MRRYHCTIAHDHSAGFIPVAWPAVGQLSYFFLVSRHRGDSFKVKSTTSSPVTVLISWCNVNTATPVTSLIIASMSGRAVSIKCVRTLFEEVPPFLGRQSLDEVLFGRGQDASEADHQQVADQVRADVLWTTAHIVVFETDDPGAHGGFDLSLCSHDDLDCCCQVSATDAICSAANSFATRHGAIIGDSRRC